MSHTGWLLPVGNGAHSDGSAVSALRTPNARRRQWAPSWISGVGGSRQRLHAYAMLIASLLDIVPATRLAPTHNHHILPLDLPSEPLGQPRPVPHLDEKGNVGLPDRFLEVHQPVEGNLLQPRAAQHQIQIAPAVTPAVHSAAICPYLNTIQMVPEERLQ